MMSNPSRSIVTGGCGFIGSHLVTRLIEEGHHVLVVDNLSTGRIANLAHVAGHPRFSIQQLDVSDHSAIAPLFKGIDWVFHLAALADIVPSIEQPLDYFRSNVTGTASVLDAARKGGVRRFVYAASSSCYGIPDAYPTAETAEIRPQYPYALTKYLGEELVMHWAKIYRLPALALRLFNVYGPRSRTSGTYGAVFGVFLAQKLAGKPFTVVGDGTQSRDFTFVTDVAQALVLAAQSHISGQAMNIGTGTPVTVNRLVELLGGEAIHVPKRPGEPDCTHADITRARELLGFSPKVSIEQGVSCLLDRIEDWRQAPVWEPGSIAQATRAWFHFLGNSQHNTEQVSP
ncbi:MAG: SDR family oxidoreductase [Deltaproteobacteria bacterium]|nr:SDR family oxidoreductase [Deltaproteobacteria bacterium]